MSGRAATVSDEEITSLTTAIHRKYGIDFTNYELKSLKRGFGRLILRHKLNSILDLWSKIMADRDFFMGCIDELTVNLTELFRNPEIWNKLLEEILPSIQDRSTLRFWHAGCSSGEEVYAMAILLKVSGLLEKSSTLATDLSPKILEKAKKGKYSSMLMNKYSVSFDKVNIAQPLEEFFDHTESSSIIKPELQQHITFKEHNLVHDDQFKKFDIIFCRNVMIYFDDNLKMKVLELFHKSLFEGGYFIIGYYDMLPRESSDFFEVIDSKTRIYKKKSI